MRFIIFFTFGLLINQLTSGQPQTINDIFRSNSRIDSLRTGELSVEIDNLTFFKDNECNSTFQKGYTLPGFWLQLKSVYQPFGNMKLEVGAHSLWFWGTNRYPAYTYRDLAIWNGKENAHNVHILPLLRANIALSEHLNFVMGNIYGGANHQLTEPLYNPELNLTSDPETGMQLLFGSKIFDADLWIDWQSFTFKKDTHREAFTTGFSSKIKANDENATFHVYFPVQYVIQHKGGELDTVTVRGVTTILNFAAGAGIRYNTDRSVLKNTSLEFDFFFNKNPENTDIPYHTGKGYYGKLAFRPKNFNIAASYWKSDNFMPLFGNPFYGYLSFKHEGMYYKNLSMLKLEAEYSYPIGKGFNLGINGEIFYFLDGYMYSPETHKKSPFILKNNRNFMFGVYLRMNPEFLLKKF